MYFYIFAKLSLCDKRYLNNMAASTRTSVDTLTQKGKSHGVQSQTKNHKQLMTAQSKNQPL